MEEPETPTPDAAEPTAEATPPPSDSARSREPVPHGIIARFVADIVIFMIGIFIGFFWSQYAEHSTNNEVHLVVILLIFILILLRYIWLFLKR